MIYNDPAVFAGKKAALISFTIDRVTYQAEDGMTWYEWCQSAYSGNDGEGIPPWTCKGNRFAVYKRETSIYVALSENMVVGEDVITPNGAYATIDFVFAGDVANVATTQNNSHSGGGDDVN